MSALQRDDAWVKTATPEQIDSAYNAGELTALLGQDAPRDNSAEYSDEALAKKIGLTLEEFGQIDSLNSISKRIAYAKAHGIF